MRIVKCAPCRDELSCRALFLQSRNKVVVFVSLDLCTVTSAFALECRKQAASALSARFDEFLIINEKNVFLSCTHTHTSPQTNETMLGFGYASEKYMTFLQKTVVSTVLDACVAADSQGNRRPPRSHAAIEPLYQPARACCGHRVGGGGGQAPKEGRGDVV